MHSWERGEHWMILRSRYTEFGPSSTPPKLSLRPPKISSPHSRNWVPSPSAWRRLRRMSSHSPKLASTAKRVIRLFHLCALVLIPDARRFSHTKPLSPSRTRSTKPLRTWETIAVANQPKVYDDGWRR